MNTNDAIEVLRRHQRDLCALGVSHAAVFGSTARGERHHTSDVDILIELDAAAKLDVFAYSGLKNFIAGLFTTRVDVVNRAGLKTSVRADAEQDAIYAF